MVSQRQFHYETAAAGVFGVKRKAATHELNDTTAKEQTESQTLGEHINLCEFFKYKIRFVGRDAWPCVFNGEEQVVAGCFDTHDDTALIGEMEGIKEQLGENDEQVMAVGLDCESIRDTTVQGHHCGMGDETACPVKGLSGQFTATDSVVGADGLMSFDERCREQFAHHGRC